MHAIARIEQAASGVPDGDAPGGKRNHPSRAECGLRASSFAEDPDHG